MAEPQQLAAALLAEFGSLGGLLYGSPLRRRRITTDPAALEMLDLLKAAMMCALRREAFRKPLLGKWPALLDYLHADMAYRRHETVRVLFLDTRNRLIQDDRLSEGTIDEATIHVRAVMARALDLGAASLLLVHNHPGGDAQPSRNDIEITRAMIAAGKVLGVAVLDHLVIARTGCSSLRAMQLI